ncbi:MAG: GDP-L-fucose synthase [Candidatus Omnitrophota bacterium]|nr:GDP-L-fucose synthase [Candidatus Omnitrophota bacterium]
MKKSSRILIVGHNDIVEKSLAAYCWNHGYTQIFSSAQVNLNVLDLYQVRDFFKEQKPDYVFLLSWRSGGIEANQKLAAEFIYENLVCQNNVIHSAYQSGVKKLLFISSSCVYPQRCRQPMRESSLFTGPLESTSEPYAVAKIAGMTMCRAYRKQYGFNAIVLVPATIYGPQSDTDLTTAHVMGALIGKFHEAVQKKQNQVVIWGSGRPRREFLYVEDFVEAAVFLMESHDSDEIINVGCGHDVSIRELAKMVAKAVGFRGRIVFDRSKPDGVKRKLLDISRMAKLGWSVKTDLNTGIAKTYEGYQRRVSEDYRL